MDLFKGERIISEIAREITRQPAFAKIGEASGEISSPYNLMNAAKKMFQERFGLRIGDHGNLSEPIQPSQLQQLKNWRQETCPDGIEMPTKKEFFEKALLARALMPQVSPNGEVQYLFGKGAGLEITVQGMVCGRAKLGEEIGFRPHSDFELYGVRNMMAIPGSREFKTVFGAQENFPPQKTKGLANLPDSFLADTREEVDLGGVKFLVPNLEAQFVDKLENHNAEREIHFRGEIDAAVLPRAYALDRPLVHKIIDEYVIKARLNARKPFDAEAANLTQKVTKLHGMARRDHAELNAALSSQGEVETAWGPSNPSFHEDKFVFFLKPHLGDPASVVLPNGHLVPDLSTRVRAQLAEQQACELAAWQKSHEKADSLILESCARDSHPIVKG